MCECQDVMAARRKMIVLEYAEGVGPCCSRGFCSKRDIMPLTNSSRSRLGARCKSGRRARSPLSALAGIQVRN